MPANPASPHQTLPTYQPGARGGVGFRTGPEGGVIKLEAEVGQTKI